MKTYAMTVGPIVDTLSMGRKTSEIWMASYLFSLMMKNSVKALKDKGADFIVPFAEDEKLFKTCDDGVGRFHDRFICRSETLSLDEIAAIVENVRNDLAKKIHVSLTQNGLPKEFRYEISEDAVKRQLADYIQFTVVEIDKDMDNPILESSVYLDSAELHTPPLPEGDEAIRRFLRREVVLNSPLAKESFGKKPSFDSIPAIAAQEKSDDQKSIDETISKLKQIQRYIAIVHADGDNLGEVIKKYGANGKEFSKKLFDFGQKAKKLLDDFGAQTLFIGGDDLLFFAPVMHISDGRTLFDLIDALDEAYAECIQDPATTLSFGVSMTYHKFPLYEALERSRDALFGLAKNYKGPMGEKNAVTISTQKHSGQSFAFTLGKKETSYKTFKKLLKDGLEGTAQIPHSLHHKLAALRPLMATAGSDRLEHIFENFFNEDQHRDRFKEGLKTVETLVRETGLDEASLQKVESMLATVKLLRGDRDEN